MSRLHHISIRNFRGITSFEQDFLPGITCIIGRGDSGKTSILEAISLVFSQTWSAKFNDSDFYKCDTSSPIIIEGTIIDVPEELLMKFSTHIRAVLKDGSIIDDFESPAARDCESALTIQLKVEKDLEPTWQVISSRGEAPSVIKSSDRAKLNVFIMNDYADRHFSMSKGNPLYSLYKQINGNEKAEDDANFIEIVRTAKSAFDKSIGEKFNSVINQIKEIARSLGLPLNEMNAMLDNRDIAINENKVSIHEDGIPFRLKGRGSKRLLSLAIQLSLTKESGLILIDEIEQGLEPDRAQHLVKTLSCFSNNQVIITTHSSNVVVELPCENIAVLRQSSKQLQFIRKDFQGTIRKNPESLFAKKILVCEGATEIGICKAINNYLIKTGHTSAACLGVRFADGSGDSMIDYAIHLNQLKYATALFCDSDKESINEKKTILTQNGVSLIDCESPNCLEQQFMKDLPWSIIRDIVELYISRCIRNGHSEPEEMHAIFDSINNRCGNVLDENNWLENESPELRKAIGLTAKKKEWFKRQDYAQELGELIMGKYELLDTDCRTKHEIDGLIQWIVS